VQGLRDLGWIEGGNVAIKYRWASGNSERYAEFAREFVRLKVDVIVSAGNEASYAAKRTTATIQRPPDRGSESSGNERRRFIQ